MQVAENCRYTDLPVAQYYVSNQILKAGGSWQVQEYWQYKEEILRLLEGGHEMMKPEQLEDA